MQDNMQPDWNAAQQSNNTNDPYNEATVQFTPGADFAQPSAPLYAPPTTPFAQSADATAYPYGQNSAYQGAVPPGMLAGGTAVPQKKRPDSNRILLGIAGIVILLALGILGVVLVAANNHSQTASAAPAAVSTPAVGTTPAAAVPAKNNVYAPYLTQYRASVREQVAQGLHLSAAQLGAQLAAGQTLSGIATAQGVSATQLQTIVTNAFQTAFQPAVTNNDLTTVQVNALVKRMLKQPLVLDRYLILRAKKAGKTPVGAATATVTQ